MPVVLVPTNHDSAIMGKLVNLTKLVSSSVKLELIVSDAHDCVRIKWKSEQCLVGSKCSIHIKLIKRLVPICISCT